MVLKKPDPLSSIFPIGRVATCNWATTMPPPASLSDAIRSCPTPVMRKRPSTSVFAWKSRGAASGAQDIVRGVRFRRGLRVGFARRTGNGGMSRNVASACGGCRVRRTSSSHWVRSFFLLPRKFCTTTCILAHWASFEIDDASRDRLVLDQTQLYVFAGRNVFVLHPGGAEAAPRPRSARVREPRYSLSGNCDLRTRAKCPAASVLVLATGGFLPGLPVVTHDQNLDAGRGLPQRIDDPSRDADPILARVGRSWPRRHGIGRNKSARHFFRVALRLADGGLRLGKRWRCRWRTKIDGRFFLAGFDANVFDGGNFLAARHIELRDFFERVVAWQVRNGVDALTSWNGYSIRGEDFDQSVPGRPTMR